MHKKILIISDIEGASGTFSYGGGLPFNSEWPEACREMSLDADITAKTLFEEGAESVTIKDFHRTGYNLLPELIDNRAHVVSGYRRGPVPGIGDPGEATALMMIGMHAPSGSSGFLAHTLTSRIARLEVNGRLMSEAELFSSSLAPFGIKPVFFSGCPVACDYASAALKELVVYPIERSGGPDRFDAAAWREGLAREAARAMHNKTAMPCSPDGPFAAEITMRDGSRAARRHASPWGYTYSSDKIFIDRETLNELYFDMIKICYLSPLIEKLLPAALPLYNLYGQLARQWVRWRNFRQ